MSKREDYAHMKSETGAAPMQSVADSPPEYPYGLRLHLNESDLEKIGLEMPAVGDTVHIMAMTRVVSTHAHSGETGDGAGVELQITHMKAEIEDDEDIEPPDPRTPAEKIYGKK